MEADARRGAALPQREVRLLRAEPLRRRREGPRRLGHVPLGQGIDARDDHGRHRDPAGLDPDGGPADPRPPPRPDVAGVHAEGHERHRAEGARVLRPHPRPARRRRRLRLHHRPRCGHADAHHRHAARHPRGGPGGDPRPDRPGPAASRTTTPRCRTGRPRHGRHRAVRRLHRLAGRAPVRRPHDRAPQRRVRGRDRHHAQAHARSRCSPT